MKGTIYKSTGSWYVARCEDGIYRKCRLAGRLKLDDEISSSNPVAVGDMIRLQQEDQQETAIITEILDRENYIVRASPHQQVRQQVLAANIDQAVLVATLRDPVTSRGFIDRFLVTAAAYHIRAILLFNKADIYKEKEQRLLNAIQQTYSTMGYLTLPASVISGALPAELDTLLQNKTTLLAGHSGSGKSTLINQLLPDQNLKTRPVSKWSGKGLHTTTFAEMFDLPSGGSVIDTPGIREWGLVDIEKTELSHYFLDMQPLLNECKFNNCLHINEPGCAVKKAVAEGIIDPSRFDSYLSILASLEG